MHPELKPENLVLAYANGIFPMADANETIHWFSPDPRAILPLNGMHISKNLRRRCQQDRFEIRIDGDFEAVMLACADRSDGTWISRDIVEAYVQLHRLGVAHSVEAWQADRLVGGLYGVALRGAFFGESMFHRETDASKVALVHLIERLRAREFQLLDVQFMTGHLQTLGAVNIPRREYLRRLRRALQLDCHFAS